MSRTSQSNACIRWACPVSTSTCLLLQHLWRSCCQHRFCCCWSYGWWWGGWWWYLPLLLRTVTRGSGQSAVYSLSWHLTVKMGLSVCFIVNSASVRLPGKQRWGQGDNGSTHGSKSDGGCHGHSTDSHVAPGCFILIPEWPRSSGQRKPDCVSCYFTVSVGLTLHSSWCWCFASLIWGAESFCAGIHKRRFLIIFKYDWTTGWFSSFWWKSSPQTPSFHIHPSIHFTIMHFELSPLWC